MEKEKAGEKKPAVVERPILGRISSHLKMGIVGLPNVGKSSLFNLMTKCEVKAENFPFCTIDPNVDMCCIVWIRFSDLHLGYHCLTNDSTGCATTTSHAPKCLGAFSCCALLDLTSSALEVVDIAGLVPGAHEGAGLGNAFLSHIGHVDGIFHMVRVFQDPDIVHTEVGLDRVR